MWVYDPVAKQIVLRTIDSPGGSLEAVLWKESASKWSFKITAGGLADGRKSGGSGHILFKDGGNTYIVGGNLTLDGKPLLKLHDVYTRLDK